MSKSNESRPARLIRSWGRTQDSITHCIEAWCTRAQPTLAWADPVPTSPAADGGWGRDTTFKPMVMGRPTWSGSPPLAEARLFWKRAALHVLASPEGGCRWAHISEEAGLELPADRGGVETIDVERFRSTVLALRDCSRFGLPDDTFDSLSLLAVEYRVEGRLVAWRLERGC